MVEGGREAGWSRPFAQLGLCTQDPGLAWLRTGHRLGSPSHGPPRLQHQDPSQFTPRGCRKAGGAAPPPASKPPTPTSRRAGPLQPAAPSSSSVRAETSPTHQGRPALFSSELFGPKARKESGQPVRPPQGWPSSPRRVCGVLFPGQPTPPIMYHPHSPRGLWGSTELTGGSSLLPRDPQQGQKRGQRTGRL